MSDPSLSRKARRNAPTRSRRSLSVPPSMATSTVQLEHRAPRPRHTEPDLADLSDRLADLTDQEVDKHPWKWLFNNLRLPKEAQGVISFSFVFFFELTKHGNQDCVECTTGVVDVQLQNIARLTERSIAFSVLAFELFVTGIVLSFGIITFWFGTWTIYDLSMLALFGTTLAGRWQGLVSRGEAVGWSLFNR